MNRRENTMKRLHTWFSLPGLVWAAILLLMASGSFAQVDSTESERTLEPDMLPVIVPFEMEVTGLDLDAGIIYLNNDGYSLEMLNRVNNRLEASRRQATFDLKRLRIGDRVIVETDGTAPSDSRMPFITAIRKQ